MNLKKLLLSAILALSFSQTALANIRYVPILSGEIATEIAENTMKLAAEEQKFITVTVVDRSGQALAVSRHQDAGVHTIRASFKKAYTANSQKIETKELAQRIKQGVIPEELRNLDENTLFVDGGVPIVFNGIVIGGIGVSGAHDSEDTRFAKAGIESVLRKNRGSPQ